MKTVFAILLTIMISPVHAADATTVPGMVVQIPAFLTKVESVRGKALTVAEKTAAASIITEGNNTANGIQTKFLGAVSKASGLDVATLGLLFPSTTKSVSNSDLTSKIEAKMGSKLGFMQRTAVTSANTLRNSSLDGLKGTLTNGVAQKLGMDPTLVTGLLPLLGF